MENMTIDERETVLRGFWELYDVLREFERYKMFLKSSWGYLMFLKY
jgi:hypothetical protein